MIQDNLVPNDQYSLLCSMNLVERFTNLTFSQLITNAFESYNFYILGLVLKQDFSYELVDGRHIYKNMMYPDECDRDDINFKDTVLYFITEKTDDISKCFFKQFSLDFSLPHKLLQSDLSNWKDQFLIAMECVENGSFLDAVNWFLKVVEQGLSIEECSYKFCYEERWDQKNSLKEAVIELYEDAAEGGDAQAQWNLALCYSQGIGVDRDEAKEFKLLLKAAKQGFDKARRRLNLDGIDEKQLCIDKDINNSNEVIEYNMDVTNKDELRPKEELHERNKWVLVSGDKRLRNFTTKIPASKIAKRD